MTALRTRRHGLDRLFATSSILALVMAAPPAHARQEVGGPAPIITSATDAYGLQAPDAGSAVTSSGDSIYTGVKTNASGTPIQANGTPATNPSQYVSSGATGAYALNGGVVWLNVNPSSGAATGVTGLVTTLGATSDGLRADGAGSKIAAAKETIKTSGAGSLGVSALNGGAITLTGSSVTGSGTSATGLGASGVGSTISATQVTVVSTNFDSYGAGAIDSGAIDMLGGSITSSSSALRVASNGTITATNVSLTATASNAIGCSPTGA